MCKNTLKKIRLFDYLIIILFHIESDFNLYILRPFKSKLLLRYITYSVTIATEQWKYLKLVYPNERRIQNVRAPAQKPSASSSHSPPQIHLHLPPFGADLKNMLCALKWHSESATEK